MPLFLGFIIYFVKIITIDYKIFLDLIIYGDFSAGDLGTHQHMTRTLMNRYGLVLFRMMWSSPSLRNTGSQTHKPECLDLPVALRLQARKVAFTPRLQMVATNLSWRRKPGSAPQVWKTWRSLTILKAPRLISVCLVYYSTTNYNKSAVEYYCWCSIYCWFQRCYLWTYSISMTMGIVMFCWYGMRLLSLRYFALKYFSCYSIDGWYLKIVYFYGFDLLLLFLKRWW